MSLNEEYIVSYKKRTLLIPYSYGSRVFYFIGLKVLHYVTVLSKP